MPRWKSVILLLQSVMGGGLLGVLSPGEKRLTGKTFYLDNVKKRPAALLVEAIFHLGGKVESFLHKDVTFVVSGSQEASPEQKTQSAKKEAGGGQGVTDSPRDGVQDTKDRPKYKPLYVQSLSFPSFCFSGHFGPSRPLPPPCPEKRPEQEECQTKPSPWRGLNKLQGYCECCLEAFSHQEEVRAGGHLVSDKHRGFLQETSNYSALDQLVASLLPGFDPNPPQHIDPSLDRVSDLVTLSDAETEKAVSALLNPVAAFDAAFQSLPAKPLPHGPVSPSPDPQPQLANPTSYPPSAPILAALLAAPRPPSPCMTLPPLDPPKLTPCSPLQLHAKLEPLSPYISAPPSDPYSQPPVLSPQVLDSCYVPHVLYLDPPDLSPEIPVLPRPTLKDMEVCGSETNHKGGLPGITEPTCCEISPAHAQLALRRASSLPGMSPMASNSKKRSRSASPRGKLTKRRRLAFYLNPQSVSKPESDMCVDLPAHFSPACTGTDVTGDHACKSDPPGRDFGLGEPLHQKSLLLDSPSCGPAPPEGVQDATKPTFTMFLVPDAKALSQPTGHLTSSRSGLGDQPPSPISPNTPDCSFSIATPLGSHRTQSSQCSHPHSLSSVCIDSALVPDIAALSPSSSGSDWDHELLSQLAPAGTAPADALPSTRGRCGLDLELLQRPCTWTHNSSYEARLHSALQPTTSRVL
ncbi:unnamed protein product [Merluccius merluccius]